MFAALLAAACAPEPPPEPVVVRDSLGIEIVENHEPAWAPDRGWRLDTIPSLEIDLGVDTAPPWRRGPRIPAGARLSDGRVVFVDVASYELRYHDFATGALLRRAGGPGRGTDRLSPPGHLRVGAGDTLYVWDEPWDGMVVFDGAGNHVRSERVGDPRRVPYLFAWPPPPPPLLTSPHSLVTAGTFLGPDSTLDFVVVARLRLEFDRTDTLVTFRIAPDSIPGDSVVITPGIGDEELYVGHVSSPEYRLIVGTRLRRIVRASVEPAGAPIYAKLIVDRLGCVWMRLARAPADGARDLWLVFDEGGRELGEVALPRGLEPLDIGSDYVLGTIRRDDGRDLVVTYGLRRD